jgi:radical SAM protein with 4Fe4S-binding SPASM domain
MNSNFPLFKISQDLTPDELFLRPALQYVCLKVTELCNARCSFCDIWKKKTDCHPEIDWLKIVDDLIDLRVKEINIHGGEAFLSKAFFPMLEHGGKRVAFSIVTNGFLLKRFFKPLFSGNISRIYISIDHHLPQINAKSRGIPGLETHLFPTVAQIKKEKPQVQIIVNHVVTSANIESIDMMLLKMKELCVDAINLIPIKDAPSLYVSEAQIAVFNEKIDRLMGEGRIGPNDFLNGQYRLFGPRTHWKKATTGIYNLHQKKSCIIPAAVMFVNGPDGNVYPCETTIYRENKEQYIMGNVLRQSVQEIWHGEAFERFRRKMFPKISCSCVEGCDPANTIESVANFSSRSKLEFLTDSIGG